MPDSKTHSALTRAALCLQTINIENNEKLISEYSSYPDLYFSERRQEVEPFSFFLDGIQFHYPPDTPYVELYRYWKYGQDGFSLGRPFVNENFRHVTAGFQFYIEHTLRCFKNSDAEEGKKYLGCLLHMLEDSCFGLHALEGAGGSDAFLLDRLTDNSLQPSMILAKLKFRDDFPKLDYVPRFLGNSPDEMTMKLYAAYCAASSDSRKCCFQYIVNTLENRPEQNRVLENRMYANAVKLCADAINTVFRIARGETVRQEPCRLEDLEPYHFPFGGFGGYRYRSFVRNYAFDLNNNQIPLELDCGKSEYGLSFGTHFKGSLLYWIAPETFREFSGKIGLHKNFPVKGKIEFSVINNRAVIDSFSLEESCRSIEIRVPYPEKEFGFSYRSDPGTGVCVLIDPMLHY